MSDEVKIGCGELACPRCGHNYVRVEMVTLYRRGDDAEITEIVRADMYGKSLHVDAVASDMSGNPSARREGLSLQIRCEECKHPVTLNIAQHKGVTLLNWRL